MNAPARITSSIDRFAHWLRRSGSPDHASDCPAREHGSRIGELSGDGPHPATLDALARELEARVGECIAAISDTFESTDAYAKALGVAADDLKTAPELTCHRLIALTLDVAETTRKIAGQMEAMHADTQRLQGELDQARRAAEEDHLTGLYNRRGFMDRLAAAVAARPDAMRTIALCNIDDFKVVNDRHGHAVGDRVLTYVARHLREQLGDAVLVGRHGGEEFACLFEDVAPDAAKELLDTVRETLRGRVLRNQNDGEVIGSVSFSAGLAQLRLDAPAAFREADAALYAAKHAGKDRIFTAL